MPFDLRAPGWQWRGDRPRWSGGPGCRTGAVGLEERGPAGTRVRGAGRAMTGRLCPRIHVGLRCRPPGACTPLSSTPTVSRARAWDTLTHKPGPDNPPTQVTHPDAGSPTQPGQRTCWPPGLHAQPGSESSVGPLSAGTAGLPVRLGQGAPARPLTMMASACLASSSETALRKPLACGVAALGVGMAAAGCRALSAALSQAASYRLS